MKKLLVSLAMRPLTGSYDSSVIVVPCGHPLHLLDQIRYDVQQIVSREMGTMANVTALTFLGGNYHPQIPEAPDILEGAGKPLVAIFLAEHSGCAADKAGKKVCRNDGLQHLEQVLRERAAKGLSVPAVYICTIVDKNGVSSVRKHEKINFDFHPPQESEVAPKGSVVKWGVVSLLMLLVIGLRFNYSKATATE